MTFLVAMFAVPGRIDMLNIVFYLNFELFGVSDCLGEMIGVLSVGNVELSFQNWFTLSTPRPSS